MRRRHELNELRWKTIAPMLPAERGRRGRPSQDNRRLLNAILWVLKTGAPWRDLPEHYGPWQTAYTRFSRWSKRGVWTRVLAELAKDEDGETYFVDATIVRAHQDASGAEKKKAAKQLASLEADRRRRFTSVSRPTGNRFICT